MMPSRARRDEARESSALLPNLTNASVPPGYNSTGQGDFRQESRGQQRKQAARSTLTPGRQNSKIPRELPRRAKNGPFRRKRRKRMTYICLCDCQHPWEEFIHGESNGSRRRACCRVESREIEALLFRAGDEGGHRRCARRRQNESAARRDCRSKKEKRRLGRFAGRLLLRRRQIHLRNPQRAAGDDGAASSRRSPNATPR